jgi:hypothetical protein
MRAWIGSLRFGTRPQQLSSRDHSEDQLFEIIIAAAFGAATERLVAAHRAIGEA